MPINYKEYPKDWRVIRERILTRAEHKCEFCGIPNHIFILRTGKGINDWVLWPDGMESEAWTADGLKATRIILTIAHLDHDKTNHQVSDDRLKALCQKCHLQYDMPRHVANRKRNREVKRGQLNLL
ncbi:MAG: hypothetical protein EOO20_09510 [Chryseobacterium sp.]|nr:MAG: hypothetical protein EOO20_09510 [Chryseobacterium sp.]